MGRMNLGRCEICDEQMISLDLLEHLRLMHPSEHGEGPDTWPDGEVVIVNLAELEGP